MFKGVEILECVESVEDPNKSRHKRFIILSVTNSVTLNHGYRVMSLTLDQAG